MYTREVECMFTLKQPEKSAVFHQLSQKQKRQRATFFYYLWAANVRSFIGEGNRNSRAVCVFFFARVKSGEMCNAIEFQMYER